jgi:GTPase Era involved in 16S rRNA processing
VKNDIQVGMVLGEGGRILKDVRERAAQLLMMNIQRQVSLTVQVVKRRNPIASQNEFDSL